MGDMAFKPHFRQCSNPACRFRFPMSESKALPILCPLCGSVTEFAAPIVQQKNRNPSQLQPCRPQVFVLLDNLRSVFNTGSIFRTCDGTGIVSQIILCGTTPTPEHPKFSKTALGSEASIRWMYAPNAVDRVAVLRENRVRIIAMEGAECADNLFSQSFLNLTKETALCLIFGNEVAGVDPALLATTDKIFQIPMRGIKESLNVAIAASIVLYTLSAALEQSS